MVFFYLLSSPCTRVGVRLRSAHLFFAVRCTARCSAVLTPETAPGGEVGPRAADAVGSDKGGPQILLRHPHYYGAHDHNGGISTDGGTEFSKVLCH